MTENKQQTNTRQQAYEKEAQQLMKEHTKAKYKVSHPQDDPIKVVNAKLFIKNYALLKQLLEEKYKSKPTEESKLLFLEDAYKDYMEILNKDNQAFSHVKIYEQLRHSFYLYQNYEAKEKVLEDPIEIILNQQKALRKVVGLTDTFVEALPNKQNTAYSYMHGDSFIQKITVRNQAISYSERGVVELSQIQFEESNAIAEAFLKHELIPTTIEEKYFIINTFQYIDYYETMLYAQPEKLTYGQKRNKMPYKNCLLGFNKQFLNRTVTKIEGMLYYEDEIYTDSMYEHMKRRSDHFQQLLEKRLRQQNKQSKTNKHYIEEYKKLKEIMEDYKTENEFCETQFSSLKKQEKFEATLNLVL